MKRNNFVFMVFALLTIMLLLGCKNNPFKKTETINNNEVVLSEITDSITAELGERCDIPKLTAKLGKVSLTVDIIVKNSNNEEVELQGRNTRFIASDINGYTINYMVKNGDDIITRQVKVTVSDSKGPDIVLPKTASSMNVKLDEEVTIPTASITDKSGSVKSSNIKVYFAGSEIEVKNNKFIAEKYGEYKVVYEAEDSIGNKSSEEITIKCARMVLLEGFENGDNVWSDGAIYTTDNAVSGNCMKISTQGTESFKCVAVYPKYTDLSGFDRFQITIYCSKDMNTLADGFYLLNTKYQLEEGENVLTISKEDFENQYPNCVIPSEKPNYSGYNYIWFQAVSSELGYFYIDNFVGIYDNYEVDTEAPVICFDKSVGGSTLYLKDGQTLVAPTGIVYDNSMEIIATPKYTALDMDGNDITKRVKNGTYVVSEGKEYTLTYTATDGAGNIGTKVLKVIVEAPPKSNKPTDYYPTDRQYDVLQNFENLSAVDTYMNKELASKFLIADEGNSIELSGNTAGYAAVFINLKKNGKFITNTAWEKYDKIKICIFSYTGDIDFYCFNKLLGKINPGYNVFTISSEDILEQINSRDDCYKENGYFWFQLNGGRGQLYFDDIIGIYPAGYDRDKDNIKDEEEVEYYEDGRTYDVLNSFEVADSLDTYFFSGSSLSTEHSKSGNSYNVVTEKAEWSKLPIKFLKNNNVLTRADFEAYDYFRIYIYSTTECSFCFLNKIYGLIEGENIITISGTDLLAQMDSNQECYDYTNGWFWCQLNGSNINIYIDELIGVYPIA